MTYATAIAFSMSAEERRTRRMAVRTKHDRISRRDRINAAELLADAEVTTWL
jgi:hypothetical protein